LAITLPAISFLGCATRHYRVGEEAVPVDALERYKEEKPEIPARIQVVNFVINSVDADYEDAGKIKFRQHNAVAIPNLLHHSLGRRKVFASVIRLEAAEPSSADYIVSGT